MPGSASSRRRACVRSAPGSSGELPGGQRGGERRAARDAARRASRAVRIGRRERVRGGKQVSDRPEPAFRAARRSRRASRAASVAAPATRDLLSEHGAHGQLVSVDVARHAPAGRGADEPLRAADRGASASATACGSESRSRSARERCTARAEIAQVLEPGAARGRGRRRVAARPPRGRAAAAGCAGTRRRATSSTPGTARPAEELDQPGGCRAGRGRGGAAPPNRRCLARRGPARRARERSCPSALRREDLARIVSLNWRTLRKPAAKAISVIGDVGRLEQDPRGLRPLRAGERERPGPDDGDELAVDVALACSRAPAPGRSTPSRSTTPSAISRIARPTRSARWSHSGEPGVASGRQRLQARKPAACAAAAVAKSRTLPRFGRARRTTRRQ